MVAGEQHSLSSSYACRTRYFLPNDRLSQHAFANAIDLPVLILADGRKIDIAQGWGQTQRDVVAAAKRASDVSKEKPEDVQEEKGMQSLRDVLHRARAGSQRAAPHPFSPRFAKPKLGQRLPVTWNKT
jgi:hypothetical protein